MSRKANKKPISQHIKTLDPKDPDTTYFGLEPIFDNQPTNRTLAFMKAFTWYNRFYGQKDAKEQLALYLDANNRAKEAKDVRKADDNKVKLPIGWLARMSLRGLELTDDEKVRIDTDIKRMLKPEVAVISQTSVKKETKQTWRPTVQDIMRERTLEVGGELEGAFDDYITKGAKATFSVKVVDELSKKNILPQHISLLVDAWKAKRDEFDALIEGKDSQLIQAYAHLSKIQVKNILKFIEQVLADLNSYISIKKAAKTPRKRKTIPVEKIVAKLKYLKEFHDEKLKLTLESVSPVKLHGASEAYLYDTTKRKMIYLIADEYSKTFTVKGTTILGFDSSKSMTKTIRKPTEQLKEFMKLGKPAGRKFFTDIRAVGTKPNGRTNENMIILKVI